MSGLAVAAIVLVSLWLAVLTLVLLLVVRQIGVLTVQLAQPHVDMNTDGPELGGTLPDEVLSRLPQLAVGQHLLCLVSSHCSPCRTLIDDLRGQHVGPGLIALLAGRDELADGLAELLPEAVYVVRDPAASDLARMLHIRSTPFVVKVSDGRVDHKTYIRSAQQLLELANGKSDLLLKPA